MNLPRNKNRRKKGSINEMLPGNRKLSPFKAMYERSPLVSLIYPDAKDRAKSFNS